jgi:hypothetical protein
VIGAAQPLTPAASVQHVTAQTGVNAAPVRPGGTVTLWVDVTPKAQIHVYAPDAKDFIPVALELTPTGGVTFDKPIYPAGVPTALAGLDERVPVYNKTFRITARTKLSSSVRRGQTLKISGVLKYQACNDRVCFPPTSLPVAWNFTIQ